MPQESMGTSINRGGVLAKVTRIKLPDDVAREWDSTGLEDTRVQMNASVLHEAQEVTFDIRLADGSETMVEAGTAGTSTVITLSGGDTFTFDEFCLSATGPEASIDSTEGITQTITLRLTSEVVFASVP